MVNFYVDVMHGKFAKTMRMMGLKAFYSNSKNVSYLRFRTDKNGVFITSNSKYKDRKNVFFIPTSDTTVKSLQRLLKEFLEQEENLQPLSLCLICNTELLSIEKELARYRVPYFVFKSYKKFYLCPECGRIYWKGTHVNNILKNIKSMRLY